MGASTRVQHRLRWSGDFFRTAEGHAATLGCWGAVLITVGGMGAGAVRRNDPLLEGAHLSWLRYGHGIMLATILVWLGVLAMVMAWVRLGRATIGTGSATSTVTLGELRAIVGLWITPLLFAVPMFSQDVYSYLAQGALLRDGHNPYVDPPAVFKSGVLLDNVSPVWTNTTAPYGPFFLLLGRAITTVTGSNVVAGTIAMRLVMLPGLILMVWAVPHLTKHLGGKPTVALWLAVLNPLVLIHLIGGVHNEMLMVGLMAAGIALVLERHHVAGIVVIAIAVAIKATAGVALPFLVWIWMIHERERRAEQDEGDLPHPLWTFAQIGGLGVVVFGVVFAATSVLALGHVDLGWISALQGSNKIINWLSLPTILAHMSTWLNVTGLTHFRLEWVLNGITRPLCAAALAVTVVWTWWRFKHTEREAVAGILITFIAIVILSPAALPWYYSWPLALAAGFALSTTTLQVLVGLCTWLMLVFQPNGSIGLYNVWHVAAATAVAVLAAVSLRHVDPLRLRAEVRLAPRRPAVPAVVSP
ncbi:alpha-(1-_6)-mannopyranosyltransferase A [Nocardia stercoris]|nr:alpha-(1->6)-mannopyranosyltransferase A [Nocardia stercoris]